VTLMVLLLAAVGLLSSAFFSGTETGFYRATRVRLVLDAMGGDHVARGLVWLTNHPSLFVATALVGNNLANYLVSLAIVMAAREWIGGGHAAEIVAPLALAPVLFVYGELLPKNVFLDAPNRLLRLVGPLFLVFLVVSFPVTVVLWGLSRILARFIGESPQEVRLTLARRELQRVLEEGHEVGILHRAQRGLAQGIFAFAGRPVTQCFTPLAQIPRARPDMGKEEVLRLAQRYQISAVPVEAVGQNGRLAGYVRVIDLRLSGSEEVGPLRSFLELSENTTHLAALTRMESGGENLAAVVNAYGDLLGVVTAEQLREPLFGEKPHR